MDITEVLSPVRDLGAFIRTQRVAAQISLRQLARQAGVSNPYLSQVERGLRRPSAEILAQIAHGLQISVESLLTMAGILDGSTEVPPGVVASIAADPVLSDRQKDSLLEIYHAFRRESEQRLAAEAARAAPTAVELVVLDTESDSELPLSAPDGAVTPTPAQPAIPSPVQPATPGPVQPAIPTPAQPATPSPAQHEEKHHVVRL